MTLKSKALIAAVIYSLVSISCAGGAYPDRSVVAVKAAPGSGSLLKNESALMPYYLYLPPGYGLKAEKARSYPLLVFLHYSPAASLDLSPGVFLSSPLPFLATSAGSGKPETAQKQLAALERPLKHSIILFPQNASSDVWDLSGLDNTMETVKKAFRVDARRVYMTGVSMGGMGAWAYALAHPETLAAAVAVCGSAKSGAESLRGLPTWTFHAIDDSSVRLRGEYLSFLDLLTPDEEGLEAGLPPMEGVPGWTASGTETWLPWKKGLTAPTGRHTLTVYGSGGHSIWGKAYRTAGLWEWVYAQARP
jgi:predicted peptidase